MLEAIVDESDGFHNTIFDLKKREKMAFFDDLETRSSDQRSTENSALLKDILNLAVNLDGYKVAFGSVDLSKFKSLEAVSYTHLRAHET